MDSTLRKILSFIVGMCGIALTMVMLEYYPQDPTPAIISGILTVVAFALIFVEQPDGTVRGDVRQTVHIHNHAPAQQQQPQMQPQYIPVYQEPQPPQIVYVEKEAPPPPPPQIVYVPQEPQIVYVERDAPPAQIAARPQAVPQLPPGYRVVDKGDLRQPPQQDGRGRALPPIIDVQALPAPQPKLGGAAKRFASLMLAPPKKLGKD
ncbi:MAG: hypothetical protein SV862_00125 [Pseudomonadota bacterium]|nr:hypothetical protein [Pseudomonadota bacterium]